MSDQHLEVKGIVTDVEKGGFRVKLDEIDKTVFARLSGKLRKNRIRILLGDEVTLKLSIYSPEGPGFITIRH